MKILSSLSHCFIFHSRGEKGSAYCQSISPRLDGGEYAEVLSSLVQNQIEVQGERETSSFKVGKHRYRLHCTGRVNNVNVIDTTGAGDAFIGGYILSNLLMQNFNQENFNKKRFCLNFSSWVAAKKIMGPGARANLPSGREVDEELGLSIPNMANNLRVKMQPFGY